MEVRWRIRTTPLRAMLTLALAFLLTFSAAIFVVAKFSASSFADVLSYRGLKEEFLSVHALADSLHERIRVNELYIENAKRLLAGQEKRNLDWSVRQGLSGPTNLRPQDHHPSSVVGLLTSSIQVPSPGGYPAKPRVQDLVRPIDGIITHKFSRQGAHLGIDLVADMRTPIHSVADGVILFSQWTLDGGNTMVIQHLDGLVSVTKHNAVNLKDAGGHVSAGEVVALLGNSGELTSGPHLHFELWSRGTPLDPLDYVAF